MISIDHDACRGKGLTYREVWAAQQAAGYTLDAPAIEAVCKCFDPLGVRNLQEALRDYRPECPS